MNDITTKEFKETVKQIDYDILLAGFPCQSFSRAGLKEGLKDKENGGLFFHISEIIGLTRPKAFLLENVDNDVTKSILEIFIKREYNSNINYLFIFFLSDHYLVGQRVIYKT